MTHFLLALFFSALLAFLAVSHMRSVRSWVVLIPTLVVYYWTLHGSLIFTLDELLGGMQRKYMYLFAVMFPVTLDDDYMLTILLYGFFALLFQITLMVALPRQVIEKLNEINSGIRQTRSVLPLVVAAVGTFCVLYLFGPALADAAAANVNLYSVQREVLTPAEFALATLAQKCALITSASVLLISRGSWKSSAFSPVVIAHIALLSTNVGISLLGGMKSQLVSAALPAVIIYSMMRRELSLRRMILVALPLLVAVGALDIIRSYSVEDWLSGNIDSSDTIRLVTGAAESGESFAAHFSLYGVLVHDVSVDFGAGITSLLSSLIPRFLGMERATTLYDLYVAQTGLNYTFQGFTLHNATGWFMEFGAFGIVLGGPFLALLIALPLRMSAASQANGTLTLVGILTFALVAGEFPQFIRSAQIEALKIYGFQFVLAWGLCLLMGLTRKPELDLGQTALRAYASSSRTEQHLSHLTSR